MILILLELAFENFTTVGREFQLTGYRLIQHRLSSTRPESLPVTMIDISELSPEPLPNPKLPATPRPKLQEILQTLAQYNPAAVAIDIDFSPEGKEWVDPDHDPQFFEWCLHLQNPADVPIPVILGVSRMQTKAPEFWLGSEKYQKLAGGMAIRRDPEKVIKQLKVPGSSVALPGLASALVDSLGAEHSPPFWATLGKDLRLLQDFRDVDVHNSGIKAREFLVDYSPREVLEREAISYEALLKPTQSPATRRGLAERLSGKMVIIGSTNIEKTTDVFSVMNEPVPGSIILACEAITLAQSTPLYELTIAGSILLNLALSAIAFLLVDILSYRYRLSADALERTRVISLAVAAVVVVAGVLLVRHTHVAWDGFLVVLVALALHHRFELMLAWLGKNLPGSNTSA